MTLREKILGEIPSRLDEYCGDNVEPGSTCSRGCDYERTERQRILDAILAAVAEEVEGIHTVTYEGNIHGTKVAELIDRADVLRLLGTHKENQ